MSARPEYFSRESVGEAQSSKMATSSASDSDNGPITNDPQPVKVNRGSMTEKRIEELVSRYGVPPSYTCRVPSLREYMSMPGPLEISVCE